MKKPKNELLKSLEDDLQMLTIEKKLCEFEKTDGIKLATWRKLKQVSQTEQRINEEITQLTELKKTIEQEDGG